MPDEIKYECNDWYKDKQGNYWQFQYRVDTNTFEWVEVLPNSMGNIVGRQIEQPSDL
jgi:hypothetical protein